MGVFTTLGVSFDWGGINEEGKEGVWMRVRSGFWCLFFVVSFTIYFILY